MNNIKCNIFDKISIILNYFEKNEKIDILNDDFFHFIYTNYIFKNKNNNNDNLQMNLDKNNNLILSNDIKNIQEENQKEKEKYKLVKKLYKKLVLKFHPDKKGDQDIFLKIQNYYEKNLLIGLINISKNNNVNVPLLDKDDSNKIFQEIIDMYSFLLNKN